jgi:hypothetical protein
LEEIVDGLTRRKRHPARRRIALFWPAVCALFLAALLAVALLPLPPAQAALGERVERNEREIVELQGSMRNLESKFDDFFAQNIALWLQMRKAIQESSQDESVHVTTHINTESSSSPTATASSDQEQQTTAASSSGVDGDPSDEAGKMPPKDRDD